MPDFLLGSLPELGISKFGLRVSEPIFSETASVCNVSDPHLAPTSLFDEVLRFPKKAPFREKPSAASARKGSELRWPVCLTRV